MAYFKELPLELAEAILDCLDNGALRETLRTAKFLRYPSEKRLYRAVTLPTNRNESQELGYLQRRFLETILSNERLAHYVVKLALGNTAPSKNSDSRVNRIIGQAMKKLINLKELNIFGYPYTLHAQLHSVPFSLTHLVISADKCSDTAPVLSLVPILQAHPNLEELALDCSPLPPDIVDALNAERERPTSPESGILCPYIKRFDGYDEGLRLFLPMRRIESGTSVGSGTEYIEEENLVDVWLTPLLIQSYQHLRVLEVWPDRDDNVCFFSTVAPYLTSLTHLQILDDVFDLHVQDYLLLSLGRIPSLKSVTFMAIHGSWISEPTASGVVRLVRTVCPDIPEIFIGGAGGSTSVSYYHYRKGESFHINIVGQEVACRPYARWLLEM